VTAWPSMSEGLAGARNSDATAGRIARPGAATPIRLEVVTGLNQCCQAQRHRSLRLNWRARNNAAARPVACASAETEG
jgi:hypothetical protein